jgi:hydroxyacylglutathione hydrolase
MLDSLDKLASLPGNTRVCCTHEYTLANLKFALAVEPGNLQLIHYNERCRELRAKDQPTLPSTIATEKEVNPFLRSRLSGVAQAVKAHEPATADDEVAVFGALRQWKNDYR